MCEWYFKRVVTLYRLTCRNSGSKVKMIALVTNVYVIEMIGFWSCCFKECLISRYILTIFVDHT